MKPSAIVLVAASLILLLVLVIRAGHPSPVEYPPSSLAPEDNIDESVARVNEWLRNEWAQEAIAPAAPADDLTVLRRMSLALHGTVPSLEEVLAFQSDSAEDRIARWAQKMMRDKRFADYFSVRLSRVLTGVEQGQFILFRRDMLQTWLARQLEADRPWDETARDLIAAEGLWTSNGASNYITAGFIDGEGIDANKLAGRTFRAFMGQRIDCAQCHDFEAMDLHQESWQQSQFRGLAAYFGQTRVTPAGVLDLQKEKGEAVEFIVTEPGAEEGFVVNPQVPFQPDWVTQKGARRAQLASWVTHSENRRFERAIANRIWGLMYGRAWFDPVDDLPAPSDEEDLLDVLGQEFREHDCSLQFLIRLIVESDAFRMQSRVPGVDVATYDHMSEHWAVFPLVRLRPEQMIGSMLQAGNTRTIDQNSNLFARIGRVTNESDFLREYGDATDDELLQQSGTIPQALLRMNGQFTRDFTRTEMLVAAGQIMSFSGEDRKVVQNCFLACLTRMPDAEEEAFFVNTLSAVDQTDQKTAPRKKMRERRSRAEIVRDLFWDLFNSEGFSWNH